MRVTEWLLARQVGERSSDAPIRLSEVSRDELPALIRACGFTNGAEIGVWKGAYAAWLLSETPGLHLVAIDPWTSYAGWEDARNETAGLEGAFAVARRRLSGPNCTIMRRSSLGAAADLPDQSLDFVYIDGNHGYGAVWADLAAWTPKIRPGGFIAGHDYRIYEHKPAIEVVAAVRSWTTSRQIDPWFVLAADRSPSFLWEIR